MPARSAESGAGFGIGAQVFVGDAAAGDPSPWPASPSGIIVSAGGSAIAGVWGRSGRGRMWVVEFDESQTNRDGDGPYPSAQVNEKYLELAPPVTQDEPRRYGE